MQAEAHQLKQAVTKLVCLTEIPDRNQTRFLVQRTLGRLLQTSPGQTDKSAPNQGSLVHFSM